MCLVRVRLFLFLFISFCVCFAFGPCRLWLWLRAAVCCFRCDLDLVIYACKNNVIITEMEREKKRFFFFVWCARVHSRRHFKCTTKWHTHSLAAEWNTRKPKEVHCPLALFKLMVTVVSACSSFSVSFVCFPTTMCSSTNTSHDSRLTHTHTHTDWGARARAHTAAASLCMLRRSSSSSDTI